MAESPGEELVELLDDQGRTIGVAPRSQMRGERHWHRCAYVIVVRPATEVAERRLVVHQRALWKDIYPGYWDVAFGGVCDVGEDWEQAALRELAEEAGIREALLTDLGPCRYEDESNRIHGRVFLATTDAPVTAADGEVVAVDEVPVSELVDWCDARSVCPDSRFVVLDRLTI